jgi:hypothetical protein
MIKTNDNGILKIKCNSGCKADLKYLLSIIHKGYVVSKYKCQCCGTIALVYKKISSGEYEILEYRKTQILKGSRQLIRKERIKNPEILKSNFE